MNPVIPIALAGAALLLLRPKDSRAGSYPGETKSPARSGAEMPDPLREQIASALAQMGVNATGAIVSAPTAASIQYATAIVGQLEAQGFYDAAKQLKVYVDAASRLVPTPASGASIMASAPPGLSQPEREHIARTLTLSRDPATLGKLEEWMMKLPPSAERDGQLAMIRALRLQLLSAQATNETLQRIDSVIKAPAGKAPAPVPPARIPAVRPLPVQTALPPPIITPAAPAPQAAKSPGLPQPLPEQPVYVPPTPVQQPLPRAVTPQLKAAQALSAHLRSLQSRYGAKGAKGKQDRAQVRTWQAALGTTADGLPGTGTLLAMARAGEGNLPWVMYWPKSATARTVQAYRDELARIAVAASSAGRTAEAKAIAESAKREHGESGIVGNLLK